MTLEEAKTKDEREIQAAAEAQKSFDEAKTVGNLHYKEGRIEQAVDWYTKCTRAKPKDSVGYSNKAMALFKVQKIKILCMKPL